MKVVSKRHRLLAAAASFAFLSHSCPAALVASSELGHLFRSLNYSAPTEYSSTGDWQCTINSESKYLHADSALQIGDAFTTSVVVDANTSFAEVGTQTFWLASARGANCVPVGFGFPVIPPPEVPGTGQTSKPVGTRYAAKLTLADGIHYGYYEVTWQAATAYSLGEPGLLMIESVPNTAFVVTVPEPAVLNLVGIGLLGLCRRKRKLSA